MAADEGSGVCFGVGSEDGALGDSGVRVPGGVLGRKHELTPAPARARKVPVRWSQALGDVLCARLAAGELLYVVLREAGMPTPEAVAKWAKDKPDFGKALWDARRAGGRPAGARGPVFTYREDVAAEIFERLCEGESLTAIGKDPTMPSLKTLFYWRDHVDGFDDLMMLGKRIQAERFCDEGMEIARAATPGTAYATHVLLAQLRWTAGVMAPRVFRTKPADLPAEPRRINLIMKRYSAEVHPETGLRHMVTWDCDPETGEVIQTWSEAPFPRQELWRDRAAAKAAAKAEAGRE